MVRLGRALVACLLASSFALLPSGAPNHGSASAVVLGQTPAPAIVNLTKAVRGGPEFVPGQPFTYVLGYACIASLTSPCDNVVITDSLPSTLSWDRADVSFGGANLPAGTAYDSASGLATFPMGALPDGSSGLIEITVRFPPGTAPGTTAVNTGRITASNALAATSNPVQVRALASSSVALDKRRATGPAQLDTPVTYRLGVTLGAGGTQTIRSARFVDDLPAGATFISATGGGTHDPATGQVTWTLGDLVPDANTAVTTTRDVTVEFRSPTFAAGVQILNSFDLFGTPDGGGTQLLGSAQDDTRLRPQGAVVRPRKSATTSELGPGQSDVYTATGTAPDTTDLSALRITDDLPTGLVAVQDGAPNLSGAGPAPTVTVSSSGGATQTVPVAAGSGGWSATVPESADSITVDFGPATAGTSATFELRAGIPADGVGRDGLPVPAGSTLRNCAVVSGEAPGTTVITRSSCVDQTVVPLTVEFAKRLTSASSAVESGGSASWAIDVGVPTTSASPLIQPVITDCLPAGFDLVDPSVPAIGTATTGFNPPPAVQRAIGVCANGGIEVKWSWPAPFTLAPGQGGSISLEARVSPQARPGPFQNEATLTADNLAPALVRTVDMAITSNTLLLGRLFARGDNGVVGAGSLGQTRAGGTVTYAAEVQNISAVPVTRVVIIDTLPTPGDTGVLSSTPRMSAWQPTFSGGVSSPQAPISVSYSTSHNPCRPEVGFTGPCEPANWSSSPPGAAQLGGVGALRAEFGGFVLEPGANVTFTWTMTTPADAPPGAVAWNSFAFAAATAAGGEQLPASEPAKVGVAVVGEGQLALRLVKRVNGLVGSQPPGPIFTEGDQLTFTYEVTNTGTVPAFNVSVVDDVLGTIPCPETELAPGESMTCTAPPQVAVAGQQTNLATALGGQTLEAAPVALDTDRLFNFNTVRNRASIDVLKRINDQPARRPPGLNIPPGEPVQFTYRIENGGALQLADITLTDDQLGDLRCPFTSLPPGADMVCTAPVQVAIEGAYVNVATATGQPRNPFGNPVGSPVSDTDRAYYTNTIVVTGSAAGPLAAVAGVLIATGLILTTLARPRAGGRLSTGRA